MTVSIRQIHPVFVGEVEGADLRRPLTVEEAAAIDAGMDKYAVLVFHNQDITDEQQLAFSANFGTIEAPVRRQHYQGGRTADQSRHGRRVQPRQGPPARPRRPPAHVQPRQLAVAFRQLVPRRSGEILAAVGRVVPRKGGNTEFADMRAAYDALDDETKAEIEDMVCEHSLMYSRGSLGFLDCPTRRRRSSSRCSSGWCARHPGAPAASRCTCRRTPAPSSAGRARGARFHARPHRARDAARIRLRRTNGRCMTS